MEKIYYEVWGNDTYANHTYLIGRYEDKELAKIQLTNAEIRALSQMEGLRDTFWITEISMEKIKERERRENERREQLDKKWDYDDERLRNYVINLVKQLMEIVSLDKRRLIKGQITVLKENNPYEEDCYSYIAFEYYKGRKNGSVGTKIKFRDGGGASTTCVIWNPWQVVPSEELYSMLIKIFEKYIWEAKYDPY